MKNLSLLIIALLFLQYSLLAQSGWISQTSGVSNYLYSVQFINHDIGWAAGGYFPPHIYEGVILNTTDGGNNWTVLYTDDGHRFKSVCFLDENTGYVVGEVHSIPYPIGFVMKTTNGGEDWTFRSLLGLPGPRPCSVFFTDVNTGWFACGGGGIYYTIDGGENWESQSSGTSERLESIFFISPNIGWAVGDGKILHTTNGGDVWSNQIDDGHYYWSVHFVDENIGWIVGEGNSSGWGRGYKTTDGGTNWILNYHPGGPALYSVKFVNQNIGWAVGESGTIIHTTNGGEDWTTQLSGTISDLASVDIIDMNFGWAVGEFGAIQHTTTGGVVSVEENEIEGIPTEYSLSQNFPNPFNPLTKIKYQIPELSFITLKVYDVLGNEIIKLVNEEKPIGSYEVEFDATGLPSGVYFYRLQAGSFVETKKMVLMK